MFKDVLLFVVFTLAYIFILTIVFEDLINRQANTMASAAGVILALSLTFVYGAFIIKKIKNRLK